MRTLLDEQLPHRLRHRFGEHHVETVSYREWDALSNGELLDVAQHEFDVLVTADRHLPDQQHVAKYDIAVVVLKTKSLAEEDIKALLPRAMPVILGAQCGRVYMIEPD